MKLGGGKEKGIAYEGEVARRLSLWLSGGERKDWFRRSSGSGAQATVDPEYGSQAGDISATGQDGALLIELFLIECKRWKWLELETVLYGSSLFGDAWSKTKRQAVLHNKIPLLIARADYRPPLLIADTTGAAFIAGRCFLSGKMFFPDVDMSVFFFDDLLAMNPTVFLTHLKSFAKRFQEGKVER